MEGREGGKEARKAGWKRERVRLRGSDLVFTRYTIDLRVMDGRKEG
jgi:hypothetical protein